MKNPRVRSAIVSLLVLLSPALRAQAPETVTTLDEVLVVGEQPGPALWKVSKDGHVLWILGTNSPSPKDVVWRSNEVEGVLAQSQEVITGARVKTNVGTFEALTLLPSLVGIRKNTNNKKLSDIVPAELYARWLVLKARYIGRDNDVEGWRPIFAAEFLYRKALQQSGLVNSTLVGKTVDATANRHKLKSTTPTVTMALDKPRQLIKDFKKSEVADLECFAKTIERLETDLAVMRTRANAWARGDVALLRRLAPVDQASACSGAVMNTRLATDHGFADLPARLQQAWMTAADAAVARNPSTFTTLSVSELFDPSGTLSKLRNKGYTVEEP